MVYCIIKTAPVNLNIFFIYKKNMKCILIKKNKNLNVHALLIHFVSTHLNNHPLKFEYFNRNPSLLFLSSIFLAIGRNNSYPPLILYKSTLFLKYQMTHSSLVNEVISSYFYFRNQLVWDIIWYLKFICIWTMTDWLIEYFSYIKA
jgi:hypothetical protein